MIATLPQSVELLERALGYTRMRLAAVTPDQSHTATPCHGWDLRDLLDHMDDALDAFLEAAGGVVALRARPAGASIDDVLDRVQTKACTLVGVWSAAAEREEYTKFMDERNDEGGSESAMALAFKRAMEKKK